MQQRRVRPRSRFLVVAGAALLCAAGAACSGGDVPTRDVLPPTVDIVTPAEADTVGRSTEYLVRVGGVDDDSGIFCASIEARISGQDFSPLFQSNCSVGNGEVRVPSGRILLPSPPGAAQQYALTFTIQDASGNRGSATRRFFVETTSPRDTIPPAL